MPPVVRILHTHHHPGFGAGSLPFLSTGTQNTLRSNLPFTSFIQTPKRSRGHLSTGELTHMTPEGHMWGVVCTILGAAQVVLTPFAPVIPKSVLELTGPSSGPTIYLEP